MTLKSEAVVQRCCVRKVFLKISKNYRESDSQESGKDDFLWIFEEFSETSIL